MDETNAADPMILDGVLVLSGAHDAATEAPPASGVSGLLRVCADAYLQGIRHVLVHDAQDHGAVRAALSSFETLLTSRGLQRMAVRVAKPGGAADQKLHAAQRERDAVRKWRRGLPVTADRSDAALETLQAIAADTPEALYAAAPIISPDRCNGCDACVRVCPSDVLTQIKDNDRLAHYQVTPVSCDACGLCVEVCSPGAIEIKTMVKAPDDIPLTHWRCPDCGVPTRAPVGQGRHGGSCPICVATGHHKKLFQVLS